MIISLPAPPWIERKAFNSLEQSREEEMPVTELTAIYLFACEQMESRLWACCQRLSKMSPESMNEEVMTTLLCGIMNQKSTPSRGLLLHIQAGPAAGSGLPDLLLLAS
jgi:hypothetical protein